MSNVISLNEKLEVWKLIYTKDQFRVHLSSHGRFKIFSGSEITYFDFFDSVLFLKELSEALEYTMCSMYKGNN